MAVFFYVYKIMNSNHKNDLIPPDAEIKKALSKNVAIFDAIFQKDQPEYIIGFSDSAGNRKIEKLTAYARNFAHLNGIKSQGDATVFYVRCVHQYGKNNQFQITSADNIGNKLYGFPLLKKLFDNNSPIYAIENYSRNTVQGEIALVSESQDILLVFGNQGNKLYPKSLQTRINPISEDKLTKVDFMYRVITTKSRHGNDIKKAVLVKGTEEDIAPYRHDSKFNDLIPKVEIANIPGKIFEKKAVRTAHRPGKKKDTKRPVHRSKNPGKQDLTRESKQADFSEVLEPVNHPVLLIVGKSGTGKDRAADILRREFDYTKIISYTTRPKRSENENNHIFISKKEAAAYTSRIASTQINGHEYFATYQQLKDNQIYIVDPAGLKELTSRMPDQEFHLLYLRADEEATKAKAIQRSDDPVKEAQVYEKRKASEAQQFSEFEQMFMTDSLPENVVKSVSVFNGYNRLFENSLIDAIRKDLAFEKAMFQSQRLELDEIEQDNDLEI